MGNEKGQRCDRNGCTGIIQEREADASCSCHIHPPCSHCTTDRHFCPECGWDAEEERQENYHKYINSDIYKKNQEYYHEQNEKWAADRKKFYEMYSGKMPVDKLRMRTEPHTHFTQKVYGVFPTGTETRSSLIDKVNGTFGGRWEHFSDHSFCFIAYTD